jgi:hypothetical protein
MDGAARPSAPAAAQPLNQALPATIMGRQTACQHGRCRSCANSSNRQRFARAWPDAPSFAVYMDSLLHDRRGGRRGFPADVQSELLTLRDYFTAQYITVPVGLDGDADAADETG